MRTTPTSGVTIFDLDGSVLSQSELVSVLDGVEVVGMRALGPAIRCLPAKQSTDDLDRAVSASRPGWLSMFGSGDFHHVTASLLKRFSEPLSVVVFDHHSDWIGWSILPCGSWLLEALKLPNVVRIVSIGVGATSIEGWRVCHGPVKEIFSGRVELYPYDCKTSRCLGRRAGSPRCAIVNPRLLSTEIAWRTVAEHDWHGLVSEVIEGLPTSNVYISIDKDCLGAEHAFTNWGTGPLSLPQLKTALEMLMERTEVVGVDICGEYSELQIENQLLERLSARFHPTLPHPDAADLSKNEDTNIQLMEVLGVL